jgi:hypothetical protein
LRLRQRVAELLPSSLSAIPIDTDADHPCNHHGDYPVKAGKVGHQVALPLGHLRPLRDRGIRGDLAREPYSFVGAAFQLGIQRWVSNPGYPTRYRSRIGRTPERSRNRRRPAGACVTCLSRVGRRRATSYRSHWNTTRGQCTYYPAKSPLRLDPTTRPCDNISRPTVPNPPP